MTPIEIAAKAHLKARPGVSVRWEDMHGWEHRKLCDEMRAALLALAECELDPDGDIVVKATLEAEDSDTGSTNEHILFAFKAMLRSIASN